MVPDPVAQTKWARGYLHGAAEALSIETESLDQEARFRIGIKGHIDRVLNAARLRARATPLIRRSWDIGPQGPSPHLRRPASALIVAAKARYRAIFNFAMRQHLTISLSTRPVDKAVGGLALRRGGEEEGHLAQRLDSPAGLLHLSLTI